MDERKLEDLFKAAGKYIGKKVGKKFWALIVPYLPVIFMAVLIFFIICWLIAAVYSAFPVVNENKKLPILAGVYENEKQDREMHKRYVDLANQYNIIDTWIVPGESSPDNTHYPGKGTYLGKLKDRYGHDEEIKLQWGQVHAATLYKAYSLNLTKITEEMQEDTADKLHPYFYYKESYVKVTTTHEDGTKSTSKRKVYLLVEAYTIQGHYQYHYKWVTHTSRSGKSKTTTRYEELTDTQQLHPNKWQRLEDFILKEYKISNNSTDLNLARVGVWEAGTAFSEYKEWLDWLKTNNLHGSYLSQATIPPALVPLFKEAEEKYGIPWWFLAAVAFKESSFNPQAENTKSHCYGLMQLTPKNWESYSRLLGFDPVLDKDNPRAQIMCGAYMLRELGLKKVDWKGDWEKGTLGVLTFYGGFRGSDAEERCLEEYAEPIWDYAKKFKQGSVKWPVPGYLTITSYFGDEEGRNHKHGGIDIAAPTGASVISSSTGRVTYAGWQNPNNHEIGYGLFVTVRDQNHLYFYGHLSQINVRVGQEVSIGDIIGKVGDTGYSSGPHLHFEVRDLSLGGSSGKSIDPLLILNQN